MSDSRRFTRGTNVRSAIMWREVTLERYRAKEKIPHD